MPASKWQALTCTRPKSNISLCPSHLNIDMLDMVQVHFVQYVLAPHVLQHCTAVQVSTVSMSVLGLLICLSIDTVLTNSKARSQLQLNKYHNTIRLGERQDCQGPDT